MSSSKLGDCLTCLRQTEHFVKIAKQDDASGDNVEAVLGRHFWFTKEEYSDRVICSSCWEKIDDFHKFYCEVKQVYLPKLKKEPKTDADPQNLSDGEANDYGFMFANECETELQSIDVQDLKVEKTEDDDPNEDSKDVSSSPSATSSSDSDSDMLIPLAKRKTTRRRKKVQIKQPAQYSCHLCSKEEGSDEADTFASWSSLMKHFRETHSSNGYMFCCGRKFTTMKTYLNHTGDHKNPDKQHRFCVECNQIFNTENNYARHIAMVHTSEEDKPYKCSLCPKAFIEEDLLNSHVKWHAEVEKLNHHCAICNRFFYGQGVLEQHNAAHHGIGGATTSVAAAAAAVVETPQEPEDSPTDNRPSVAEQEKLVRQYCTLNCSQCVYIGKSFNDLSRHASTVHQIKTNAVVCCEKRFHRLYRLYEHCLRHLDPDWFKCKTCGKTCRDSDGLQHHIWTIHTPVSERPFKCDICGDAFMKNYLLKYHLDRHLAKERKKHSCKICGNTYTSMLHLKSHEQRVHGAMSDWVCDVCAKGFACRSQLEFHRKMHTEEGLASLKMQCETCFKWLNNKRCYVRHRRGCGDGKGPAQCDMCSHVSVNQDALASHKRLNHGDVRKYACKYCGKEFKKQLRLKEHEANHEGIILYKCPFCPRMCNSSSNMYTHKKVAHPEQWAEAIANKHKK